MVRPVDFYRAPALKVCKFCGQLHDIMTDELIISKFHWMGEKKTNPAGGSYSEGGAVDYIRSRFILKINK